jgi:hypothetical protein
MKNIVANKLVESNKPEVRGLETPSPKPATQSGKGGKNQSGNSK